MRRMIRGVTAAVLCLWAGSISYAADEIVALPGTQPLMVDDDLSAKMVEGLHTFLDRKLEETAAGRRRFWKTDLSSLAAYERSIEPYRERFKTILGVVDRRVTPALEFVEDDGSDQLPIKLGYRVRYVRWAVLDGVTAEGWHLKPPAEFPVGRVVVTGDADQSPEEVAGLVSGIPDAAQIARRLAEDGFEVLVPMLIDRSNAGSGNPEVAMTDMSHREWIYRQAFEMGRHIIGYEVQKVLAAVDWFREQNYPNVPIGVAGYGEGGLIAFYAAACDPRIKACFVSGYFGPRERVCDEPIYRNVWGLLREFGDAEIAGMVLPRNLFVEYSEVPVIGESTPAPEGRRIVAAPGTLKTPGVEAFQAERERIETRVPAANSYPVFSQPRFNDRIKRNEPFSACAAGESDILRAFVNHFTKNHSKPLDPTNPRKTLARKTFHPGRRQLRQVKELERHIQEMIPRSDKVRDAFFLAKADRSSPDAFARDAAAFRKICREEMIGRLDNPQAEMNPRSRKSHDTEKFTGYEVMLDVWPDVFAWGILLLPKDLKPGEKRPVVVCQHGLEGVPEDTITAEGKGFQAYRSFAAKLAERGFITFSPHNPYRGGERYRSLQRKLNPLKASLGSVIVAQHTQILNWLEKQPFVDKENIGFYGLSYGGWSASRIPPLLERYKLSICSACFNDWARKTAGLEHVFCYMYHAQHEMPEWNLGHTFNNAELAYLMVPRPFMVERGHHDGVSIDSWVAGEYAKVRWLYTQLGIGDRTEIEYFNGGHIINGQGTFEFLHKHLGWPKREEKP